MWNVNESICHARQTALPGEAPGLEKQHATAERENHKIFRFSSDVSYLWRQGLSSRCNSSHIRTCRYRRDASWTVRDAASSLSSISPASTRHSSVLIPTRRIAGRTLLARWNWRHFRHVYLLVWLLKVLLSNILFSQQRLSLLFPKSIWDDSTTFDVEKLSNRGTGHFVCWRWEGLPLNSSLRAESHAKTPSCWLLYIFPVHARYFQFLPIFSTEKLRLPSFWVSQYIKITPRSPIIGQWPWYWTTHISLGTRQIQKLLRPKLQNL
jgi:hypothetical protein